VRESDRSCQCGAVGAARALGIAEFGHADQHAEQQLPIDVATNDFRPSTSPRQQIPIKPSWSDSPRTIVSTLRNGRSNIFRTTEP
jgi:hypothetical protein